MKYLKVYYDGDLNKEIDEAIEKCLSKFNLRRWASGYDLVRNERDLAFEKDKKSHGAV